MAGALRGFGGNKVKVVRNCRMRLAHQIRSSSSLGETSAGWSLCHMSFFGPKATPVAKSVWWRCPGCSFASASVPAPFWSLGTESRFLLWLSRRNCIATPSVVRCTWMPLASHPFADCCQIARTPCRHTASFCALKLAMRRSDPFGGVFVLSTGSEHRREGKRHVKRSNVWVKRSLV